MSQRDAMGSSEMDDSYQLLEGEIDRILRSPYPSQLRTLHDLLQSCSSIPNIHRWADSKPCLVSRLSACLCHALPQWPYVLEIVTKVSRNVHIRDSILEIFPTLLHSLVENAVRHADVCSSYSAAAVAVLSHALPSDIAIPEDAQTLFVRLIGHAAQNPSTESLKPACDMLNGISTSMVHLLGHDTLSRLEENLYSILRNYRSPDDQRLSMYCLTIMKSLVKACECASATLPSFHNTQDILASTEASRSPGWRPERLRQFFRDDKAGKTLHLILLRVYAASRPGCDEPYEERLDSLRLADQLVAAVPRSFRVQWSGSNMQIVQKLLEKLSVNDADPTICAAALAFVGKLCDVTKLPTASADRVRQMIVRPWKLDTQLLDGEENLMECFAVLLDRDSVRLTLMNIISHFEYANSEEVVTSAPGAILALQQLKRLMDDYPLVSGGCDSLLDDPTLLKHFLAKVESSRHQSHWETKLPNGACERAVQSLRHRLGGCLASVCIKRAMTGAERHVSPISCDYLLKLYKCSASADINCGHSSTRSSQWNTLPADEPSQERQAALDWRVAVAEVLDSSANAERRKLTSVFSKACADLETRCNEVEAPLRRERDLVVTLRSEIEQLNRAYSKLEADGIDCEIRLRTANEEKDDILAQLSAAHTKNEGLANRAFELEQSIRNVARDAEMKSANFEAIMDAMRLDHDAALARHQAEIEDLHEQATIVRTELEQVQERLGTINSQLTAAQIGCNTRDLEIAGLREENDEKERRLQDAVDARRILDTTTAQLRDELESQAEAHLQRERQLQQGADGQLEAARAGHDTQLAGLKRTYQEEADGLCQRFSELQEEFQNAREYLNSEIRTRDITLGEFHQKIDRLKRRCDQKDEQIQQAIVMRNNLMAALNLDVGQVQLSLPTRARDTSSGSCRSSADFPPVTPAAMPSIEIPQPELTSRIAHAPTVSSLNSVVGPTPKRPKSNKSVTLNVPDSASIRGRRHSVNSPQRPGRHNLATTGSIGRQPLAPLDGNSSPTKSAINTPGPQRRKTFGEEYVISSFDSIGIFDCTQGGEFMQVEAAYGVDDETEA